MISIQSYRLAIGLFQFKIKCFKTQNSTYDDLKRGERGRVKLNLILIFFLLGVCVNSSYGKRCQEANNKNNHSLNGNISKKGTISLFSWNLFAIHKANFDISRDKNFDNNNIEYNTIIKGYNISRTILLIKKGIVYKRRKDFENEYISSVWVQIILSKKVSTFICSFRRS